MSTQYVKCLDILESHPESLICLTISPDGNFLVSSCCNVFRLWDLRDGTLIRRHNHYKRPVGFSLIISPSWKQFITDYDGLVEIKDFLTGETTFHFDAGSVFTSEIISDGNFLVTGEHAEVKKDPSGVSRSAPIKVWNLKTGELIRTFQGHDYTVSSLIASEDGRTLLSHSYYYSTKIWDMRTGQKLHEFSLVPSGYRYWVDSFAITSTGEMVATGCKFCNKDGGYVNFEMWNLITGQIVHTFPKADRVRYPCSPPPSEPQSVMTSDGKVIVSGSGINLEVWDGHTGEILCCLQGHESQVKNIAISQGGDKIASYGEDGIRIWKRAYT